MTIPPKKVVNANPGDADHVGGNDWDDLSDFLNNVDMTGPVKINTRIYFRSGKREDRNPADTFSLIHVIPAIVANRNVNWPLLTADGKPVIDTFLNIFTVDQQFNAGIIGGGYLQLTNDETITLTGTQNNLTVAATSTTVRLNPASTLTITGITGGIDGRILFLDNVSTVNVILSDDDALSTVGNRILLDVTQTLLPNQSCALKYDSTSSRWRLWASTIDTGGGTPAAHASSHKSGGSDVIKLDEFGATTDVTTLNASTTAHGLLKKLSNVATEFMNGVGNWVALTSETTGTATGTANGVTTVFNIAHGLGSSPFSAFVQVSSVLGSTINRSYTTDATNIIVTFASAPTTGTITFHWRAVA